MNIVANIIYILHVLLFIATLTIPFSDDRKLLSLYSFIIVFVFFHWILNDDTCFLTHLESRCRNVSINKTFMQRLIGPIYNMNRDSSNVFIKFLMFFLWFVVQLKLTYPYLFNLQ